MTTVRFEDTANRKNERERRRVLVSALLLSKLTYRQMVAELAKQGVTAALGTIANDVREIRRGWRDRYAEDYAAHVSEHMAMLDALERTLVPKALAGGLPAVDRLLAVMDRRAKLLGLDAPSKVEVSLKIELVARALEQSLEELGVDPTQVRPVLGRKLRELEAAPG